MLAEYAALRDDHASRQRDKNYLTIEAPPAPTATRPIGKPRPSPSLAFLGTQVLDNYPLDELARYIDWTPFFHTWELKGRYPRILEDDNLGEAARRLFEDAQRCWPKSLLIRA